MTRITLLLLVAVVVGFAQAATNYALQTTYDSDNFYDMFTFFTDADPTEGWVQYVSYDVAQSSGIIYDADIPTWGVDNTTYLDPSSTYDLRKSIRLTSTETYTHGLFIADFAHMPGSACGTWPAFWTFGQTGTWPYSGEIDIVEYVNNEQYNLISGHTADGCTISGADQTGSLLTNDCDVSNSYTGCSTQDTGSTTASGSGFNSIGGGVYAMEWTSDYIHVWFFPRGYVPETIKNNDASPDVSSFGTPVATLQGDSCNIDDHFFNHAIVFDTTFCGSWAGDSFEGDGCPMTYGEDSAGSCVNYVANTPSAFSDSYWAVNFIKVYQPSTESAYSSASSSSTTSSYAASSVVPRASTASVEVTTQSVAQGATTTVQAATTETATTTRAFAHPHTSHWARHAHAHARHFHDNDE